jgi:hypothetical protein
MHDFDPFDHPPGGKAIQRFRHARNRPAVDQHMIDPAPSPRCISEPDPEHGGSTGGLEVVAVLFWVEDDSRANGSPVWLRQHQQPTRAAATLTITASSPSAGSGPEKREA